MTKIYRHKNIKSYYLYQKITMMINEVKHCQCCQCFRRKPKNGNYVYQCLSQPNIKNLIKISNADGKRLMRAIHLKVGKQLFSMSHFISTLKKTRLP